MRTPFTSESKEAIADYDEIRKEMKLALMECGRKLGTYLRKRLKMRREGERRDVFERYIGEIAKAVNAINGTDAKKLYDALLAQAKKRTAIADLELDEEGKAIKHEDPADQEGVIIVPTAGLAGSSAPNTSAPPQPAAETGKKRRKNADAAVPAKPKPREPAAPKPPTARKDPAPAAGLFGDEPAPPAKKKVLVRKKVLKKKA